jgi:hypothetical protein
MSLRIVPITVILSLFIFGCATTRETSFKDPAARANGYEKFVVVANLKDLAIREKMEKAFVTQLSEAGVDAIPSTVVYPPTRDFDKSEFKKALQRSGDDAVLIVGVTKAWQNYSVSPGYSQSFWTSSGVSSYYVPGSTIAHPRVKFDIALYDISLGKKVWVCSAFTAGNGFAGLDTLCNSVAAKTIDQLKEDGILHK